MRWTLFLAAAILLAGFSDAPESPPADDADPTPAPTPTPTSPGQDPSEPDMPSEPPTRWDNQTAVVGLADCTLIAALVGAGAPADAASQAVSVSLQEEDWGRPYEVTLIADVPSSNGAPSPASLCVAFDGFAFGAASGTVPDGAETMVIGGDALIQGDLAVRIG